MSAYVNYDSFSNALDERRPVPTGLHLEIGAMYKLRKPLKELHVLDAGAGTGRYAQPMLDAGVGKMTLIDASKGMLKVAKEKLKDFIQDGRADIFLHKLPMMPFEDETFDVVLFNFVLNHLDPKDNFESAKKSFAEAKRVLKQGGLLVIETCFRHQIMKASWFHFLFSQKALDAYGTVWMEKEDMVAFFKQIGLRDIEVLVPTESLDAREEEYFSGDWILDPTRRNKDEIWAVISDEEMIEIEERVKDMINQGTMNDFIEKHDQYRKEIGQIGFVFAMK